MDSVLRPLLPPAGGRKAWVVAQNGRDCAFKEVLIVGVGQACCWVVHGIDVPDYLTERRRFTHAPTSKVLGVALEAVTDRATRFVRRARLRLAIGPPKKT